MLAGGSGRRLGAVDKPALLIGGRTLLEVALAAVEPACTVVVGPSRDLPASILQTREDPAGGGPAAAVVAGLEVVNSRCSPTADSPAPADPQNDLVSVLAADLPGIEPAAVESLTAAVIAGRLDGAVLSDPDGRSQYLAGVWRLSALSESAATRPSWVGGRVSDLLLPLIGARIPVVRAVAADVDTAADLLEWGVARPASGDGVR